MESGPCRNFGMDERNQSFDRPFVFVFVEEVFVFVYVDEGFIRAASWLMVDLSGHTLNCGVGVGEGGREEVHYKSSNTSVR